MQTIFIPILSAIALLGGLWTLWCVYFSLRKIFVPLFGYCKSTKIMTHALQDLKDPTDEQLYSIFATQGIVFEEKWQEILKDRQRLLLNITYPNIREHLQPKAFLRRTTLLSTLGFWLTLGTLISTLSMAGMALTAAISNRALSLNDTFTLLGVLFAGCSLILLFLLWMMKTWLLLKSRQSLQLLYEQMTRLIPMVEDTRSAATYYAIHQDNQLMLNTAIDRMAGRMDLFLEKDILQDLGSGIKDTILQLQQPIHTLSEASESALSSLSSLRTDVFSALADEMAQSVSSVLQSRAESFADTTDELRRAVTQLQQGLSQIKDDLSDTLISQRQLIEEVSVSLGKSATLQENTANQIPMITTSMQESTKTLSDTATQLDTLCKNTQQLLESLNQARQGYVEDSQSTLSSINDSMSKMTQNFSTSVEGAQSASVALERTLEQFSTQTDAIASSLQSGMQQLSQGLVESQAAMTQQNVAQLQAVMQGLSTQLTQMAEALGTRLIDGTQKAIDNLPNLLMQTSQGITEKWQAYSDHVGDFSKQIITSNTQTAEHVSQLITRLESITGNEYTAAAEATERLLEGLSEQIHKAMQLAGESITKGIISASQDTADTVSNLSGAISRLKEEYELLYQRMDMSSHKAMDDLEFNTDKAIAGFANEVNTMIERLDQNLSKSMFSFEQMTSAILVNLEEQARSIGLSARTIDIDITELSSGLKESIGQFAEQIKTGIHSTFEGFDEGLADINKRLANTILSIREAIDTLPDALRVRGDA